MSDIVLVQMLLAGFVMYTCFCRLVFTHVRTSCLLRSAIILKATAMGLVLGMPVLPLLHPQRAGWEPWTTPTWVWVFLLVSLVFMQWATARYWDRTGPRPIHDFKGDTL